MDPKAPDVAELDVKLNAALSQHYEEQDPSQIEIQRRARIQEYQEAALSRPDPFAAMMGASNADLQRISDHYSNALVKELDDFKPSLEELEEYRPYVQLLIKLRSAMSIDLVVAPQTASDASVSYSPKRRGIKKVLDGRDSKRWKAQSRNVKRHVDARGIVCSRDYGVGIRKRPN